nr:hypothetical protein [Tanacetum cinerariifolium]
MTDNASFPTVEESAREQTISGEADEHEIRDEADEHEISLEQDINAEYLTEAICNNYSKMNRHYEKHLKTNQNMKNSGRQ